jgi:hypothetical protein
VAGATRTAAVGDAPDRFAKWAPWVIGLAFAIPVLVAFYPPMSDIPPHEATISLLAHWSDTTFAPHSIYQLNVGHMNQLFHLCAAALTPILGSRWALKVVVALTLFAIPVCAARFADHLGAPRWTALLVAPLGLGWLFFWGLEANLAGIAALLFVLPMVDAVVVSPTPKRIAATCAGFVLLYFAHYAMLLVAGGALGLFALLRGGRIKDLALRVLPGIFIVLVMIAQRTWQSQSFDMDKRPTTFTPVVEKIASIPKVIFAAYDPPMPLVIFLLAAIAVAVLAKERWAHKTDLSAMSPRERWYHLRYEIVITALVLVYLIAPLTTASGATLVYQRFLPPAYAIGVIRVAPAVAKPARLALAKVACVMLPVGSLLLAWPAFVDCHTVISELEPLMSLVEKGSSIAVFDINPTVPRRLWHPGGFNGHVVAARGGRSLYDYTISPIAPVKVKPEKEWTDVKERTFVDPRMVTPDDFHRFRYLLVYADDFHWGVGVRMVVDPFLRPVAQNGRWWLYESKILDVPIDGPDAKVAPDARPVKDLFGDLLKKFIRKGPNEAGGGPDPSLFQNTVPEGM